MNKITRAETTFNNDQIEIVKVKMKEFNINDRAEYLRFVALNARMNCFIGPDMDSKSFQIGVYHRQLQQKIITQSEFEKLKKQVIES